MGLKQMKQNVARFIKRYPKIGRPVLDVYNQVNPFGCYYGEEENPDEYLRYADEFCRQYYKIETSPSFPAFQAEAILVKARALLRELVRRSFDPCMLVNGNISQQTIRKIADRIGRIPNN